MLWLIRGGFKLFFPCANLHRRFSKFNIPMLPNYLQKYIRGKIPPYRQNCYTKELAFKSAQVKGVQLNL